LTKSKSVIRIFLPNKTHLYPYLKELLATSLAFLALLYPLFFIVLRLTAFGTLPFDNYTDPVLHLAGAMPEFQPYAPTCYRFLYIYTGYFFYLFQPEVILSNVPALAMQPQKYAALQALAAASFFYLFCFVLVIYHHLCSSLLLSAVQAIAVSLVAALLALQMAFYGADPSYLFYIALLLHCHQQKSPLFGPLMLLSFLVNEKIGLVSLAFWGLQFLFQPERKQYLAGIGFSLGSILLYFAMRSVLAYPGYENQTNILLLPERLAMSWAHLNHVKGWYVNLLPLALLLIPGWYLLKKSGFADKRAMPFLLLPMFTFALGCFACSDYSIGRVAMHAMPFLIFPVARHLRAGSELFRADNTIPELEKHPTLS
jgi:hypothetical protein